MTLSSKNPYIFITLGWFKNVWIFNYLINCSVIYSSFKSFFSIIFNAQIKLVFFSFAKYTWPYFPAPNYFICSKSEIAHFFYFFLLQDCLTHAAVGSKLLFLISNFSFMSAWRVVSDEVDLDNSLSVESSWISLFSVYNCFFLNIGSFYFSFLWRNEGIFVSENYVVLDLISGWRKCSLILGGRFGLWIMEEGILLTKSSPIKEAFILGFPSRKEGIGRGEAALFFGDITLCGEIFL